MFCHTLIYIVIIYILIPKVNTNKLKYIPFLHFAQQVVIIFIYLNKLLEF